MTTHHYTPAADLIPGILNGDVTQLRVAIPYGGHYEIENVVPDEPPYWTVIAGAGGELFKCPFGQPGDTLLITLENGQIVGSVAVEDVRVERLDEARHSDAVDEGIETRPLDIMHGHLTYSCGDGYWSSEPGDAIARRWDADPRNAEHQSATRPMCWVAKVRVV